MWPFSSKPKTVEHGDTREIWKEIVRIRTALSRSMGQDVESLRLQASLNKNVEERMGMLAGLSEKQSLSIQQVAEQLNRASTVLRDIALKVRALNTEVEKLKVEQSGSTGTDKTLN